MGRILQLPESVVAKIAAGEVVERPASAVKELMENSVDAGATRIDVEIDQGGTDLIRVVDDGGGIAPEDLALAFSAHATSKLTCADDLFQVSTLGFRGEALASIGGVAQVTLQSRQRERDCGAEIGCHGSALSQVRPCGCAPGTRIEARHLFFNTPVRRKFLRSVATEAGHVCEVFTRLALAQPQLHLTLRHNGKTVFEVPPTATLLDRLGLFFGKEVRDKLYAIETDAGPVRLTGYVADPSCERGTAKMQYLFLNGRWIRDRSLGHALQEAYRGLLMTGRYAVAFLFLEMPPDLVDVNVHPTKTEVRFREGQGLYNLVLQTIRKRLSAANLTPRLQLPAPMPWQGTAPAQNPLPESLFTRPVPSTFSNPAVTPVVQVANGPSLAAAPVANGNAPPPWPAPVTCVADDIKAIQLYNAYLVLETADGMLVIDQHALHERILFEELKGRIQAGTLEVQPLLIPETVDLPGEQAARVLEHSGALAKLGMGVQDFGGGTVLVTSYPALLGHRSPQAMLKAIVDHLATQDRLPTREQLFSDLMSLMACHSAVRSGDSLTQDQIAALVAQRRFASDTHHCPHGRPTSLLFSRRDLDRQFRRI
jgi:DNA mismatch repair protein MutL